MARRENGLNFLPHERRRRYRPTFLEAVMTSASMISGQQLISRQGRLRGDLSMMFFTKPVSTFPDHAVATGRRRFSRGAAYAWTGGENCHYCHSIAISHRQPLASRGFGR
jgi:hypothetical protein